MAFIDLGTLKVGVTVDGESAKKGFQDVKSQSKQTADDISTDWSKVANNLNTVGSNMTKYLTLPILAIGAASVKLASDMDETSNKIDATFKENSETVKQWANTSIESMGMAQQTALDAAATFGDMGSGMGIVGQQSVNMSTSLVQLAADLASFKNISVDRANVALAGIYTGETEALKGLGIVMTEANLEQFAMNQGITKSIKEFSQAEKVTLRYQYVMSVTSNAQGDFSRTSNGLANQSRILKENLKELGVQFGNVLLPAVNNIVTAINGFLKSLQTLSPETQSTIVTFGLIVAAIGPMLTMISKAISSYNAIKNAVVAANLEINATAGIIAVVAGALTLLIGLVSAYNKVSEELAKESEERVNKILEESAAKVQGVAEAEAAATEETKSLTDSLIELSESNPDIDIRSNAKEVKPEVDNLKDSIGNLLFNTDNLEQSLEDVNVALDEYMQRMTEARRATTVQHVIDMAASVQAGTMTQDQYNQAVNTAIQEQLAWEAAVSGSDIAFDGLMASFQSGQPLTMQQTTSMQQSIVSIDGMADSLDSAREGVSRLTQAEIDGTITDGTWRATAQETAALLNSDVLNALNQATSATAAYDSTIASANATEAQQRADAELLVASYATKKEAGEAYMSMLNQGISSVDAIKEVELMYGSETAAALKAAFQEKYGTTNATWQQCLSVTSQWTQDIKTLEQALNTDTGKIAQSRKDAHVKAEEQLKSKLSGITTGWTDAEIREYARMAQQSGFKLDEGFVKMLLSTNDFVTNNSKAIQDGAEFVPDKFKTELGKTVGIIKSNAQTATGASKGIGEGVSDGVAVGIKNHQYKAVNAAVAMVEATIRAAKRAGDINSPSKKTEKGVGKELAAGVGVGWDNEIKNVTRKVKVGIGNITVGSGATVQKKLRDAKSSNDGILSSAIKAFSNAGTSNNNKIEQNNYFQSKPLTPYEQTLAARRNSRELARALR